MGSGIDPHRASLIRTLFFRAVDLNGAERISFLNQACGSDEMLRTDIESLLAADAADDRFIVTAITKMAEWVPYPSPAAPEEETAGWSVGPYTVIELIGRGGVGSVYRAIRQDQFRMQVALKLIKRGVDTDLAARQFRNEEQILAQLQHPNIARLLDGGVTDDGLPYFVMEHVEGEPITVYCRTAKLDIYARLRLFQLVCKAVQFAHQHLIVHRDLKPSNILITAEGIPKLLDFGIAKLLEPTAAEQSYLSLTGAGMRLMTPHYASPEQILGLPLTTATDIYSLGVVLYELLTGLSPYRTKIGSSAALEQAICQQDPQSPAAVCKQVDQELATIVLMALHKEPQRRYNSIEQFSGDIRRYLEHRPIAARKDNALYRWRKFVQRHTIGAVMCSVMAATLMTGVAAVHSEAVRAQRRFQQVRKLADTIIFDLHDEIASLPGATKARQLLVKTAVEYLDSLAVEARNDPQLQRELATAYEKIGDVQGNGSYSNLGEPATAVENYRKGLAIANRLPTSKVALELITRFYYKIGNVQEQVWGRPTDARENLLTAVRIADSIPEKTGDAAYKVRIDAATYLGGLDNIRNPERAVGPLQRALFITRQWKAAQPSSESAFYEIRALQLLGEAFWQRGDLHKSLQLQLEAIPLMEELLRRHPDNIGWQHEMALCYEFAGLVAGHPQYLNLGDHRAAANWFRKMLEIFEQQSAADSKDMRAQFGLSEALASLAAAIRGSDPAQAELLYGRSLALNISIAQSKPDDALAPRWQAFNRVGLAWVLSHRRLHRDAIQELEKALSLHQSSLAKDPMDPQFRQELGVILCALGKERGVVGDVGPAAIHLHHALSVLLPLWQSTPRKLSLRRDVADCYEDLGDLAALKSDWNEARWWYTKSYALWGTWSTIAPSTSYDLTQAHHVSGSLDRANRKCKEVAHSR
jgi:eukaryotic-like serine/threonine-protein kinase